MTHKYITVKCNDPKLNGIKDPYTGETLDFTLVIYPASQPRCYSTNAFDIHKTFKTSTEAHLASHTRGGVQGALKDSDLPRCPYTDSTLTLTKVEGGYKYIGGFYPLAPVNDLYTFINYVRHASGLEPVDPPKPAAVVDNTEENLPKQEVKKVELTQASDDLIKAIVDGAKTTTTVSMSQKRKRKQDNEKHD